MTATAVREPPHCDYPELFVLQNPTRDMDYDDADGTVTVSADGTELLRYRAHPEDRPPHVDRLALPAGGEAPAGRNLVLASPHGHPWHYGCWFVQKLVDGVNCWEGPRRAAAGRLHGRITAGDYTVEPRPEQSADLSLADRDDTANGESTVDERDGPVGVTQTLRWETSDGDPLLGTERRLAVHDPGAVAVEVHPGYLLTWQEELTALETRRYLSSESFHGRYGGLSMRLSRELRGGRIRLPDATDPEPNEDSPGRWCDYTGSLDGNPSPDPWRAGVTVMSNSATGRMDWFTRSDPYGLLCANPVWRDVVPLDAGDSVTWSWGMWVHAGDPDRETIERVDAAFRHRAGGEQQR